MRATKHSGVDWLGDVPETWGTTPLRTLMKLRTERNTAYQSANYLSLMANIGVIPYAEKGDIGNKAPEDLGKCKIVYEGDFVLNSMNFGIGSFGVSAYNGICSSVYVVMQPRLDKVSPPFLRYIFTMQPFQKHVQSLGNGILEHRAAIGWDELKNIGFPMPPKEEQRGIADFLDRETAKIDKLIAKQEQLITTLGERRKALISKQISQGSNLAEGLVDSGNPQIGKFPRQWKAKRLRHFARLQSGADYKEIETSENGFPVYGSGGIFTHATKYMYDGESVLFGRKGTIDRPLYVNGPFWTVDTMYWTRFVNDINPKFVYYWATTLPFGLFTTATALPSMTASDIKNFFIGVPPRVEQDKIVQFLDAVTSSLDALGKRSLRVVEVLKERRQALISAAVTGKLEVGV